jgi:hypothetical protein
MKTRILVDYRGRSIRLTAERLQHVLEHPEMHGLENLLEEVLQKPEQAIQSRSDPEMELFYRLLPSPRVGAEWLCAVVKYRPGNAFLLTAYLTDRPKKGTPLWPVK